YTDLGLPKFGPFSTITEKYGLTQHFSPLTQESFLMHMAMVQTESQSVRYTFWRLPFTKTWQLFGIYYKRACLEHTLRLHRANGRRRLCFIEPRLQQLPPSLRR